MMIETGYAKVNLALHVRRRRDDGYHDIETVFAFCADGDRVEAEPADALTLTIDGAFSEGLAATDNLVIRAADAMGVTAKLHLTKRLPVASGIGGGSADAAATLRLLSAMSGAPLPDLAIQCRLGADVPACVVSQTARGQGVGERLIAAERLTGTPILLVNPRISLSTASVFRLWDGVDRGPLGDWREGRNDLYPAARGLVPELDDVIGWLASQRGAQLTRMSGSGATCFSLFDSPENRDLAASQAPSHWWSMASVLR